MGTLIDIVETLVKIATKANLASLEYQDGDRKVTIHVNPGIPVNLEHLHSNGISRSIDETHNQEDLLFHSVT